MKLADVIEKEKKGNRNMFNTLKRRSTRKTHRQTLKNAIIYMICVLLVIIDAALPVVAETYSDEGLNSFDRIVTVINGDGETITTNLNSLHVYKNINSGTNVANEGNNDVVLYDTSTVDNNLETSQDTMLTPLEGVEDEYIQEIFGPKVTYLENGDTKEEFYGGLITVVTEKPKPLVADYNNVTTKSNASAEQLQQALVNTNHWMAEYDLGQAFYDMEQKYGINAFFAMAVTTQEVGFKKSPVCIKYNNMFGIRYRTNGTYKYRPFNSYEECIEYFYELIANTYVNKWGKYDTYSINQKYCETDDWYQNVNKLMTKLLDNASI